MTTKTQDQVGFTRTEVRAIILMAAALLGAVMIFSGTFTLGLYMMGSLGYDFLDSPLIPNVLLSVGIILFLVVSIEVYI